MTTRGGTVKARERTLLTTALAHFQAGRLAEAEALYRKILSLDPKHVTAHKSIGTVLAFQGKLSEAIVHWQVVVDIQPKDVDCLFNLGLALQKQHQLPQAIFFYQQALSIQPTLISAIDNLAHALKDLGRFTEAIEHWERILALQPNHLDSLLNLGSALREQGMPEQAILRCKQALSLKPDQPEVLNNFGNVLKDLGRLQEAVDLYGQALRLKPHYPEALTNLGNALRELGRLKEAIAHFELALRLKPERMATAEMLNNLSSAYRGLGNLEQAAHYLNQALALNPDLAEARLAQAVLETVPHLVHTTAEDAAADATFHQGLDSLAAWSSSQPAQLGRVIGLAQPFYLAYRNGNHQAVLSPYGDMATDAAAAYWLNHRSQLPPPPRRERLRLSVISGQIRHHSVWDVLLRGIVAHLDRQRFELVLYHTSQLTDDETVWPKNQADHFIQGPMHTAAWIERLSLDQPDILFYPELGMDPVTCCLASLRLAPVQVASWGHPITTGLSTIDAFLSGELLEGPKAETHYRERLLRLPGTGACTEALPYPAAALDEATFKFPADRTIVRFALCQNPQKFNPGDDELYVRIAKEVGPCQFWFPLPAKVSATWASHQTYDRLAAAFRQAGLTPEERIVTFPWLSGPQFLGFLDEMDVYLDCPGFSGYTTARQALHRGLPIVTLEGAFLRQRLAAGLLRQINQTQYLATTREEYVTYARQAAQSARNSDQRIEIRTKIRAAACRADGNIAVIRALEQHLIALCY